MELVDRLSVYSIHQELRLIWGLSETPDWAIMAFKFLVALG